MGSVGGVGRGKLVYAMHVGEVLPLERYDRDSRFRRKKPGVHSAERLCGDNIYSKGGDGAWTQRPSFHTAKHMRRDLGGRNALVAEHFYYFGSSAVDVPSEFNELVAKGRGHKCEFNPDVVAAFLSWLQSSFPAGIHGAPRDRPRSYAPAPYCNAPGTSSR